MIQKEVDSATAKAKKMKTGIIAGIFGAVAIIVLVLILTYVNITGGFIKIPKESFIPAENVTLMGDAAKYFKIGGNGITLYYGDDTGDELPRISGQLVAQGDIKAEVEKQYKDFLAIKKWNAKDCTTDLRWNWNEFNDYLITMKSDIEDSTFTASIYETNDFLYARYPVPFGTIIHYTLNGQHPQKKYRKAIANIMNAKTCRIDLEIHMEITNETLKEEFKKSGKETEDTHWYDVARAYIDIK